MVKSVLVLVCMFILSFSVKAQVGVGLAYGVDLYEHISVPNKIGSLRFSGGSALANLVIGPKLWFGTKDVSLNVQAQVGFAPFHFDTKNYRGLGAFYFPVSVGLNYGALSGFSSDRLFGFNASYGIQGNTVDLYLLDDDLGNANSTSFSTQFVQAGVGTGKEGIMIQLYGRYGWAEDKGRNINVGVSLEYNWLERKKYKNDKR